MKPPVPYFDNADLRHGYFRGVEKIEGHTQERMRNCGLSKHGKIHLLIDDADETVCEYTFAHAGATRDFVVVKGQSWGIKFEEGNRRNHCKDEWQLYGSVPELRKRTPRCYLFCAFR